MKYLLPFFVVVLFAGCQPSKPQEPDPQEVLKELEKASSSEAVKLRQARDSCLRQNRINDTNVDCDAKFPLPK